MKQAPGSSKMETPFLLTMQYLETKDIFKVLALSKKARSQFFTNGETLR